MQSRVKYEEFEHNEEVNKLKQVGFHCENAYFDGVLLPASYKFYADEILNLEIRDDDVFVISFPKSGTTWTQELVYCVYNDADLGKAKEKLLDERFPFLEIASLVKAMNLTLQLDSLRSDSVEHIKNMKSPRFIKTHLPVHLLPKKLFEEGCKAKIVYVARDPRDACVSFYHHESSFLGYKGDLRTFVKLFLENKVQWTPYWTNVLGYWKIRNSPNILFVRFEDMKKDLSAVIRRVADFLNKSLTDQQVQLLTEHLSFESMKNNTSVNLDEEIKLLKQLLHNKEVGAFIRSGKSGGFLKELTKEEIKVFDDWCKKNTEGTDYELPNYISE